MLRVIIDGRPHTLTLQSSSAQGYRYNTEGNKSQHSFPFELRRGMVFRINGHRYEVLR